MSFLSDVFEGNFGNLGHDLSAHFSQDLPWYLAGGAALTGGLGLAGIGPAAALAGGAEAVGAAGAEAAIPEAAAATAGDATALGIPGIIPDAGAAGGIGSDFAAGATPTSVGPALGPTSTATAAGGGTPFNWGDFFTKNFGSLAGAGVAGAGLLMAGTKTGVPGQDQLTTVGSNAAGGNAALLAQIQQQQQQQQQAAAAQAAALEAETKTAQQQQQARIAPIANDLISQYQAMIAPLSTGVLPAGAEQALQNAKKDAINTIKSKYANLGISGSSGEADALANVENQITAQRFSIAEDMAKQANTAVNQALTALSNETATDVQLLTAKYGDLGNLLSQSGIAGTTATGQALQSEQGLSSLQQQIFSQIMNATVSQNQQLGSAIGNFAGALGKVSGQQAGQKYTLQAA